MIVWHDIQNGQPFQGVGIDSGQVGQGRVTVGGQGDRELVARVEPGAVQQLL